VGNLTVGGTGKTPMVEWVARWYRKLGVRVVVLSRGYAPHGSVGILDEAAVLEENLPDVPHLLNPDRVRSAEIAVEELESEVIVLDDGFQHRQLARDVDLVLLDALEPFGMNHLLPRGLLREPIRSLGRASVVVLTRADLVDASAWDKTRAIAEKHAGPLRWVVTSHAPRDVIGAGVQPEPVEWLQGKSVAAFCGIGNPEGFFRAIEPLCGAVVGARRYYDHYPYGAEDVVGLSQWVRSLGADLALTTQKDLVKLQIAHLGAAPLRALRIGMNVIQGGEVLEEALAGILPIEHRAFRSSESRTTREPTT
jgi:tetraacyldisaccharide 4'-kinase